MTNATAAQAPNDTTTGTADDIRFRALVIALTTYAMHASPERVTEMMRDAYGDLVPGWAARSQALDDDLAGRRRKWATCDYVRCSQVFERRGRRHRFCSKRCQRAERRRRERLRPLPPVLVDPRKVAQECMAAFRALVGGEAT